MNRGVSIVYSTFRRDPAFRWFADGLARQLGDDDVDLVVVDGFDDPGREAAFATAVANRFTVRHVPAKPTVFNGPHRRVSTDMHAASSARNTGIVVAAQPYIVFIDDCTVPMPGWWDEVKEAARHQYVVCGAYQKRWDMHVVDGELVSSRAEAVGVDVRWESGDDRRLVPIPGSQLFGSGVGVPRQLLVEVDGYDEICDGTGGEDYHLGVRLEHVGQRLFYSRRMLTIESEEHHRGDRQQLLRIDPVLAEPDYLQRLADFGVATRSTAGRCDASHLVLDILYGRRATASLGNHYRLGDLQPADLEATAADLPTTYWFDGRDITDL